MDDNLFAGGTPVTLEEMLNAREARVRRQRELLKRYPSCCLVSFTMNLPGAYKRYDLAVRGFREGRRAVETALVGIGAEVCFASWDAEHTGCQGFLAVARPPEEVKTLLMAIEDNHPLGRLFDLDVLDGEGRAVKGSDLGRGERTCLICGGPVWACSRARVHDAETLARRAAALLRDEMERNGE